MEVLAGGLAASLSCVFTNPMEVVKNRYLFVLFLFCSGEFIGDLRVKLVSLAS